MTLLAAINSFISENTLWVAYSGGLDSQVLLAACAQLRKTMSFDLRAIHVNHHLHPNANKWQQHCENYCVENQIEFHVRHLQLAEGDLENAARKGRYQIFSELLGAKDIMLVAHHQEDQAETLLLQLLRGAGPKGLAAMPTIKKLGNGYLARPFLTFPRETLQAYATQHQLTWIEDESNTNVQFARNFLRHEVMPTLKRVWPTASHTIARSAQHCSHAQALLEEFSVELCLSCAGSRLNTLSVQKLLALPQTKQPLVLRSWIYQHGFDLPNTRKLQAIIRNVLNARWDRTPLVQWSNAVLRRYRDDLYLMPPAPPHDVSRKIKWTMEAPLEIAGIGTLTVAQQLGGFCKNLDEVTISFRQGGEVATLEKRRTHELKKLFQEWGVLPWERNRIPLVFHQDKLISALGYYIDPEYKVKNAEEMGLAFILSAI